MGKQGLVVETGEGKVHTMVWGWGAVILGVGITVSAIILSSYIGLALTILSGCAGVSIVCVGIGEGIKRARQGRAAEIAAERGYLPKPPHDALPWKRR